MLTCKQNSTSTHVLYERTPNQKTKAGVAFHLVYGSSLAQKHACARIRTHTHTHTHKHTPTHTHTHTHIAVGPQLCCGPTAVGPHVGSCAPTGGTVRAHSCGPACGPVWAHRLWPTVGGHMWACGPTACVWAHMWACAGPRAVAHKPLLAGRGAERRVLWST